ncbi:glycosyltransferase family 2 protein [Vibrio splendidus]
MFFFSVIIPVYNVESYLPSAIDSVVNQECFSEIQVILVNDGSTDNSINICLDYEARYPNIVLFDKVNGGLSSARNVGIENSLGKYLVFLDSDDFLSPGCLDNIYTSISANGHSDIIMCKITRFSENKPDVNDNFDYPNLTLSGRETLINVFKNSKTILWSACRSVYRRDFFFSNKFVFTENITSEDLDLIPFVILKAETVSFYNGDFYWYRVGRESSIVNTVDEKRFQDVLSILDKYNNFFSLSHDDELIFALKFILGDLIARYILLSRRLPAKDRNLIVREFESHYGAWLLHSNSIRVKYLNILNGIISLDFKIKLYEKIQKLVK